MQQILCFILVYYVISLLVDHDAQNRFSVMPNILPFQMLSIAVFSHLIIMHSFHNGLEAKVKLVSDPPICVSNEPNYSYIIT